MGITPSPSGRQVCILDGEGTCENINDALLVLLAARMPDNATHIARDIRRHKQRVATDQAPKVAAVGRAVMPRRKVGQA
jgi:hypothetical protein